MKNRRPGLQSKWSYVVNSLQEIIPSYELASSRISLFADRRMRAEAISFAVADGSSVLDLGAGPGTMSRLVARNRGEPVLLDVSRSMLKASSFRNKVQAVFEFLPFREGVFDGAVSGFALRDAHDLKTAMAQVARVLKRGGRLAFCDLGKPDSAIGTIAVGYYMRVVPNIVGLVTIGRSGLRYGSLFDTYVLALHNSELVSLLSRHFTGVAIHEMQMGSAIVAKCVR
ncbi:MAG: methyltransferase domain-containing protein [Nitrososphaerales archaeon]|nr:methyltransferase domain-containing protein [Nitrososphaerales archaeon]